MYHACGCFSLSLLYSLSISTVVTAIGIFLKDRYDTYARSRSAEDTWESVKVYRRIDSWETVLLPSTEIVEANNFFPLLARVLESDYYGVFLFWLGC